MYDLEDVILLSDIFGVKLTPFLVTTSVSVSTLLEEDEKVSVFVSSCCCCCLLLILFLCDVGVEGCWG